MICDTKRKGFPNSRSLSLLQQFSIFLVLTFFRSKIFFRGGEREREKIGYVSIMHAHKETISYSLFLPRCFQSGWVIEKKIWYNRCWIVYAKSAEEVTSSWEKDTSAVF